MTIFDLVSLPVFYQHLHETLRVRLSLPSHADHAAYLLAVGHPAQEANRYFNTTLNRVVVFAGGVWREQGGPVLEDQG